MKALVKFAAGSGNMELRDVPDPVPGPGQVKIAADRTGICGSDLHILLGQQGRRGFRAAGLAAARPVHADRALRRRDPGGLRAHLLPRAARDGSLGSRHASWEKALALMAAGAVRAGSLISDTLPLRRWSAAFKMFEKKQCLKLLLDPSGA